MMEKTMQRIKNWIGNFNGFTVCPNCGDSLYWKEFGHIYFLGEDDDIYHALMICRECLETPEKLDFNKIINNLKKDLCWIKNIPDILKALSKYKENALIK